MEQEKVGGDSEGQGTALHRAVLKGISVEGLQLLMGCEADVNARILLLRQLP